MNIDNNVKHQRKYTWLNLQGLNNTDYHLTILYIRQYTVLYMRLCYNVKNSKIYIYFTTYIDACYVYFQKKKIVKILHTAGQALEYLHKMLIFIQ